MSSSGSASLGCSPNINHVVFKYVILEIIKVPHLAEAVNNNTLCA